MGRRSGRAAHAAGVVPGFDTVGMNILPGVSMPEWAEAPAAAEPGVVEASTPEAVEAEEVAAAYAAHAAHATAPAPAAPAAHAAPAAAEVPAATDQAAPERAYAMAGAGAMAGAAAMAGPPPAGAAYGAPPAGGAYGAPAQGYPEPSRYPAAPAAGLGAPAPAQMSTYADPGYAAAPAAPQDHAGSPATAGTQDMSAAAPGTTQTLAPPAPTGTQTAPGHPLAPPPPHTGEPQQAAGTEMSAPAPSPTETWRSTDRPELSPEHVALLSWWADMIAAGQFPPPPGADGPNAAPPAPAKRAFPRKAVAIGVAALAAVGLAVAVGPKVLAGSEPEVVVPATEVVLPASVSSLVLITDPQVGEGMRPLLGFGVRPAGVTVTGAYGVDPAGPLAVAALATTIGAPADDAGQISAWSQRTGSTVGEPLVGSGESQGVTCVTASEAPSVPAGSFCVWTGTGMRGQTYSVAMSAEDAAALTTQLRATTTNSADAAAAEPAT
jgi:hypothetical protein